MVLQTQVTIPAMHLSHLYQEECALTAIYTPHDQHELLGARQAQAIATKMHTNVTAKLVLYMLCIGSARLMRDLSFGLYNLDKACYEAAN